jgi:hypothetical protein
MQTKDRQQTRVKFSENVMILPNYGETYNIRSKEIKNGIILTLL